jgi:hypothetical protein
MNPENLNSHRKQRAMHEKREFSCMVLLPEDVTVKFSDRSLCPADQDFVDGLMV